MLFIPYELLQNKGCRFVIICKKFVKVLIYVWSTYSAMGCMAEWKLVFMQTGRPSHVSIWKILWGLCISVYIHCERRIKRSEWGGWAIGFVGVCGGGGKKLYNFRAKVVQHSSESCTTFFRVKRSTWTTHSDELSNYNFFYEKRLP